MKDEEQTGVTDADAENGTREHPPGGGGKVGLSSLLADSGPDSIVVTTSWNAYALNNKDET